ncbi:resolvase [Pseudoflavonifractor sp. 60]|uniref:resolvase n=1 Tax=Pseudoflavonifractor sp. 60 TaxID=2304576 RepID=UPI00136EEF96|nr:resolvase [Pseudoflavonifractor sp. 60]NBI65955.1 resolvase [Pseudoflavonifractor sp. 60]
MDKTFDIQRQVEIEKLLSTDALAYGYVYQDGQRTEYLFQGTPENIAYFIGSRPYVDEMIITDAADWPILNTIGYFIDKCPDQGLLDEIKKTLVPIQKGEAQAQPFFCPTLDEVEDYCAQRDLMDMDEDREMDTDTNIDLNLGF